MQILSLLHRFTLTTLQSTLVEDSGSQGNCVHRYKKTGPADQGLVSAAHQFSDGLQPILWPSIFPSMKIE